MTIFPHWYLICFQYVNMAHERDLLYIQNRKLLSFASYQLYFSNATNVSG